MKKIFISVLAIFILLTSVVSAAKKSSADQPELLIGLFSNLSQVSIQVSKPCVIINPANGKVMKKIPTSGKIKIDFRNLKTSGLEIRPEKDSLKDLQVTINDKKFYGGVKIKKGSGSFTVINIAPIEEYLRGVLSQEMSPSFPLEALKAQAVAARSYAMKNRNRHGNEGYDLCAGNHCQAYVGIANYDSINKAIEATRGEVITFQGEVASTNFHSDSGGMTENISDVWGSSVPYLVAVKENFKPSAPWTVKVSSKEFLSRIGGNIGKLKSIKLSKLTVGKASGDRTSSGRVKFLNIVGSKKSLKINGEDLRRKFSLPSTLFDIKSNGNEIIFTGYGSGHGVGMAQIGAKKYAENGWSYKQILEHYYKGTKLTKLY